MKYNVTQIILFTTQYKPILDPKLFLFHLSKGQAPPPESQTLPMKRGSKISLTSNTL